MKASVSVLATLNNPSDYFIVALYDASAPNVVLEFQPQPPPYDNPWQVMFSYNLISGHVYLVKLWENTVNTGPGGVVRCSAALTADQTSTTLRADEYVEADVTPGVSSGATGWDDTTYVGWVYSVERIGMGTMYPDSVAISDPDYHQKSTGGVQLLKTGDSIQINEKFVVRFAPQLANAAPTGQPSPPIGSGQFITGNTTMDNSYANKALWVQGAGSNMTAVLPLLSTFTDFNFLYFFSAGGTHKAFNIVVAGTDKIQMDSQVTNFTLCQNEICILYKANGVWNIFDLKWKGDMVGEFVYKPGADTVKGTLQCIGQLVNRADYPRLWLWAQTFANIVSDSVWSTTTVTADGIIFYTRKVCFSTGDTVSTFRLPDMRGIFIRTQGGYGAASVGLLQIDAVQLHNHDTYAGRLAGDPMGYVPGNKLHGQFNSAFNGPTDLTGQMYNNPGAGNPGTLLQRIAAETRPLNAGEYLFIRY